MSTISGSTTERQRLLVGFDGSDAATEALGWAGRLARRDGSEIVVARMFTPGQAEVSPEGYADLLQGAMNQVEEVAAELLDPLGVTYRTVVEPGTEDALLRVADLNNADLIVVGPRGDGGFAALHIGSTAHHLAHCAERPVAIIPSHPASTSFDTIVVGIDGSSGSTAAVDWSSSFAMRTGAEVVAVHSFEPFIQWVPESDPTSIMRSIEREIDECTKAMRAQGVRVRTTIVKDIHPVAALASIIEKERAGLAVVGRRGRGGFAGLILGRVPEQLVHHAHVPVVVVPSRQGPGAPE